MRLTLTATPRRLASRFRGEPGLVRVIAGAARFAADETALDRGEGLELAAADGVVTWDRWPGRELWVSGDGTPTVVEVIIP